MTGAPGELVLPRRVKPQPTPAIVPGGDCGPCVVGGVLDWPVERVYDELVGKRDSIEYGEMQRVLRAAVQRGAADRIANEPPTWHHTPGRRWARHLGAPAFADEYPWFCYLRMGIDAGYYGIANVDSERKGFDGDGSNHWVLLCGARVTKVTREDGLAWWYRCEVLVSCSMRRTGGLDEWVEARDFLRYRGGADLLMVRPAP